MAAAERTWTVNRRGTTPVTISAKRAVVTAEGVLHFFRSQEGDMNDLLVAAFPPGQWDGMQIEGS